MNIKQINSKLKKYCLISFFSAFCILMTTQAVLADNVHPTKNDKVVILSGEYWCPFSCKPDDEKPGLLVDLLKAAFKQVDIDIYYDEQISWKRAGQQVKNGKADILLTATSLHSSFVTFEKSFYVFDESAFIILSDSDIKLNEPNDLHLYTLGVMSEYLFDENNFWEAEINNHLNITKVSVSLGEPHLLNLLKRKRVDIAVLNYQVANFEIKQNRKPEEFQIIRKNAGNKLYSGFAKTDRGQRFQKLFRQGLSKLKESKELNIIYSKYHMDIPEYLRAK